MQATYKLHSLPFNSIATYMAAALFVIGNLVLPQLFHMVPDGGRIWLPIYFFTLVGAYKYGWRVGVLTALISPIANSLLFGMPMAAALPAIMIKSLLLAIVAGYVAQRSLKASLGMLALVVVAYQFVGTIGEWILKGDLFVACQDFRLGIPGMLLQILGGWVVINYIIRK